MVCAQQRRTHAKCPQFAPKPLNQQVLIRVSDTSGCPVCVVPEQRRHCVSRRVATSSFPRRQFNDHLPSSCLQALSVVSWSAFFLCLFTFRYFYLVLLWFFTLTICSFFKMVGASSSSFVSCLCSFIQVRSGKIECHLCFLNLRILAGWTRISFKCLCQRIL